MTPPRLALWCGRRILKASLVNPALGRGHVVDLSLAATARGALGARFPTLSLLRLAVVSLSFSWLAACGDETSGPGRSQSFARLSAGKYHTCGISVDGRAYCWGEGDQGQLGDGSNSSSGIPTAVASEQVFTAISAGSEHTCAVGDDGTAHCWGGSAYGQAGSDLSSVNQPAPVAPGLNFVSIGAGGRHTCALAEEGSTYCWGSNGFGQLGSSEPLVGCSAGTDCSTEPVAEAGGLRFAAVSVGKDHSCGLTADGNAYCWGRNANGQLGDGSTIDRGVPVAVSGGFRFAALEAGRDHTCGLNTRGRLYCWGRNDSGQLGSAALVDHVLPVLPVTSPEESVFAALSAGGQHTCAITTSRNGYCWGANELGQLGDGTVDSTAAPVRVVGSLRLRSVQAGLAHTCGLNRDGIVYCWGRGFEGQLGNDSNTSRLVPVQVEGGM